VETESCIFPRRALCVATTLKQGAREMRDEQQGRQPFRAQDSGTSGTTPPPEPPPPIAEPGHGVGSGTKSGEGSEGGEGEGEG
jgi:hypothetical protein